MFFDSWAALGRIALTGPLIYLGGILLLRLTGKRTLSKWNAFDFIITVALGSTLAAGILSEETTVFEGLLALALIMGLQYVATWLSVRSATVQHLLKSEPTLLLYQGQYRAGVMREKRVPVSEVRAAVRSKGIGSVERVGAVVLETDGSFTVIENLNTDSPSAMMDVVGFEEEASS
jgi:uncharacterized membrane protein YcaP (DUF421 family)